MWHRMLLYHQILVPAVPSKGEQSAKAMMAIILVLMHLEVGWMRIVERKEVLPRWNLMEIWKLGLVNCVAFPGNREQVL